MKATGSPVAAIVGTALVTALAFTPAVRSDVDSAIERGDAHWRGRAEGQVDGRPRSEPIEQAMAAYEEALAAAPDNLEARWKLMRALVFLGDNVETDKARQIEVFDRGRALGEEGIDKVAKPLGGRDRLLTLSADDLKAGLDDSALAAEIYFWSAAHTGLWGRTRGKMASAREGVATKIRDYATVSVRLDPSIENGGGHRILGRLHTEAPKIPFITGWVDRKTAVAELEECRKYAPEDLTTRMYLGEALIKFVAARRGEGVELLRSVVAGPPNAEWLIEELKAQADAKVILDHL